MKHIKLITHRKSKGLTQKQMASKVAMEQTTYSRKERGLSPINEVEWNRFAKALNVSIKEIKEHNNAFAIDIHSLNGSENDVQFINLPHEVYDIIIKYNHKLEEENLNLKKGI